jgi:hypothetical protein
MLMRRLILAAIVSGLAGCVVRYPLNCPPYDPAQYGDGPGHSYCVTRSSYGFVGHLPPPQPYAVAPPHATPPSMPYYWAPGSPPPVYNSPAYRNPQPAEQYAMSADPMPVVLAH